VILCGSPAERPLAADIVARVRGRGDGVAIATDDLPIPRLLALLVRAHSMISVNTGPAHAAAAMGCPLVVLFARHAIRSAPLYAPLATTAPVQIILPDPALPEGRVASIAPDTVLAAWQQMVRL
jgi:heptosyltransferase-2/heptosyltransferase-3